MKIIISFLFVLFFASCLGPPRVYFHLTENSPKMDTMIYIKNLKNYLYCYRHIKRTFNDTIIVNGVKQIHQLDEYSKTDVNTYRTTDSVHFSFDKYKATKVDVIEELEFF